MFVYMPKGGANTYQCDSPHSPENTSISAPAQQASSSQSSSGSHPNWLGKGLVLSLVVSTVKGWQEQQQGQIG